MPRDRILIVESDPVVSDLIGRQALQSVGYQVQVATDASTAISKAIQWAPDLIMVDLNLPGLSGKDLLVALASQGIQTPLIIIARRGTEADIVQTFRLGAADYILLPAREAEVVNAVSRVLKQVHDRRERDRLAQQLQQANQELQSRVRELTTIFSLGKAMTSVTDQAVLLDKILDAALQVTQADMGWFLLREDLDRPFLVAASRNLPSVLGVRLNQPWDDGISSLVAMSGEPLTIHGDPLKRFKISSLGKAALITPLKAQKKVIGLLVMLRKNANPFGASEQHLVDALADYASISLVNARLFRAVEERARSLQSMAETALIGEKVKNEILLGVKNELAVPAQAGLAALDALMKDPTARLRPDTRQQVAAAQDQLTAIQQVAESISPLQTKKHARVNFTDLVNQSLRRIYPHAQRAGVSFAQEIPKEALAVSAESSLLSLAIDSAFIYMIRLGIPREPMLVRLSQAPGQQAQLLISSGARMLTQKEIDTAFDDIEADAGKTGPTGRFTGLGIRLYLVKEIVLRSGGKIWLESHNAKGAELHLILPLAR